MANAALVKTEDEDAALEAARELLNEGPEAALLRVRGYVAVFFGCAPEDLGPVLKEEPHVGEKD